MVDEEQPSGQPVLNVTVTRSPQYRTIFSNFFTSRTGTGEITIVFSTVAHAPSVQMAGNIVEEQVEIAMAWPQLKMLQQALDVVVKAIEQEVGEIPVPTAFRPNLEAQRTVIRSLGLPPPGKR